MSASTESLPALDWRARPLLTIPAAAAALGLSRGSGYNAVRAGQWPTIKIGHTTYIPTAALRRLLGELVDTSVDGAA